MTSREQFYSTANETMLDRLLYADFKRRTGGDLTEKQVHRLEKTVKHYMTEVYTKQPGQSLQYLNKEVLTSVVPDYMSYLRRGNAGADTEAPLQMDVTNRFDRIQQERQEVKPTVPNMPDFQISFIRHFLTSDLLYGSGAAKSIGKGPIISNPFFPFSAYFSSY